MYSVETQKRYAKLHEIAVEKLAAVFGVSPKPPATNEKKNAKAAKR